MRGQYLQRVVLGDPLHHVGHSGLKDLLERERVHHCEDAGKMLQDFLLLLHADSLAVGHPDVRLLVICNLHLFNRRKIDEPLKLKLKVKLNNNVCFNHLQHVT